jgi:hypothetical protein
VWNIIQFHLAYCNLSQNDVSHALFHSSVQQILWFCTASLNTLRVLRKVNNFTFSPPQLRVLLSNGPSSKFRSKNFLKIVWQWYRHSNNSMLIKFHCISCLDEEARLSYIKMSNGLNWRNMFRKCKHAKYEINCLLKFRKHFQHQKQIGSA